MSNLVTVTYVDGMHLQAHTPHYDAPIPLDSDEAVGGQGKGHRPLQMLLVGLGGCMAMDALSILRKKRQEFDFFEVTFETEQRSDHPKAYTTINMHVRAGGANISAEALARALELSYEKYCPANAMLREAAQINYTYEIVTAQGVPS